MSTTEIYRAGDKVSMPVPANTKAGAPLRIGSLNAIAATDRANTAGVSPRNADGTVNAAYNQGGGNADGNASVWFDGGHQFTVAFAAAVGDRIYLLADGSGLSGTATNNSFYGHALSAKGATSGPLTVRIAN